MSLNKFIKNIVNAVILSEAEDALEEHQECLSEAVSPLIKAGAPASEIARAAFINGYAHGRTASLEEDDEV
jgi:hypothetical protein